MSRSNLNHNLKGRQKQRQTPMSPAARFLGRSGMGLSRDLGQPRLSRPGEIGLASLTF